MSTVGGHMRASLIAAATLLGLAGTATADGPPRAVEGRVVDGADAGVASATVTLWAEVPDRAAPKRGETIPEDDLVAALSTVPPVLRPILHSSLEFGEKL